MKVGGGGGGEVNAMAVLVLVSPGPRVCGSGCGDDGNIDGQPENSLLGSEVHLDGRVAPGVVDLPGVDLLDGHPGG